MTIWMIACMGLAYINLIFGNGRKWKFTHGHLLWFLIGVVVTAIPYQCMLDVLGKK